MLHTDGLMGDVRVHPLHPPTSMRVHNAPTPCVVDWMTNSRWLIPSSVLAKRATM